ncbi:MAG TPA: hypothetical protein VJA19_03820 [Pseudomonas sp.]|nr:hypothetical protein [Pseudomonas sp.]
MSYSNGVANDMDALRSALISACTAEGWTLSGDILSKGTTFIRLQIVSGWLTLLGGTGISAGALTGAALAVSRIGQVNGIAITWPANYELFVFAAEVYLVVNYNVNFYQWLAWGKSTVQGLPGSGMWYGASMFANTTSTLAMNPTGSLSSPGYNCPGLFWRQLSQATNSNTLESRVHTGLDGFGWADGSGNPGASAIDGARTLLELLPNSWNSEAILLPIRAMQPRPSNKISLVADLQHARYTRIDNYTPGEVITLGADRWKVYPWYRKDAANRNGGQGVTHTGTLGWAIRYEGP